MYISRANLAKYRTAVKNNKDEQANVWTSSKHQDLQFGFKPNHSRNCVSGPTWIMKHAINYYNNNTTVYACMLDASKASDLVHS